MERRRFIRNAAIIGVTIGATVGAAYLVPTCVSEYEKEIRNRPQPGDNNLNPQQRPQNK